MTFNLNRKTTISVIFLTLFFSATLSTVSAEKGRKGHHKPPQEAIDACAGQTDAGNACSFTNRKDVNVEGECKFSRRNQETLICRPSGDSKRKKRQ